MASPNKLTKMLASIFGTDVPAGASEAEAERIVLADAERIAETIKAAEPGADAHLAAVDDRIKAQLPAAVEGAVAAAVAEATAGLAERRDAAETQLASAREAAAGAAGKIAAAEAKAAEAAAAAAAAKVSAQAPAPAVVTDAGATTIEKVAEGVATANRVAQGTY